MKDVGSAENRLKREAGFLPGLAKRYLGTNTCPQKDTEIKINKAKGAVTAAKTKLTGINASRKAKGGLLAALAMSRLTTGCTARSISGSEMSDIVGAFKVMLRSICNLNQKAVENLGTNDVVLFLSALSKPNLIEDNLELCK